MKLWKIKTKSEFGDTIGSMNVCSINNLSGQKNHSVLTRVRYICIFSLVSLKTKLHNYTVKNK